MSTTPRCGASLSSTYGIEIGTGAGRLAGQIWRIGCMGHTACRRNVFALLVLVEGGTRTMTAARAVRDAALELRGKRVLLRSLTENDFAAWHEVRTRCASWLLRWEPRPKGAPAPSEDRPSFAARYGIRRA